MTDIFKSADWTPAERRQFEKAMAVRRRKQAGLPPMSIDWEYERRNPLPRMDEKKP